MPRFAVTFCDPTDGSIETQLIKHTHPQHAIVGHHWIQEVYLPKWIETVLLDDFDTIEGVIERIFNQLGWHVCCVNLDEEIMKDLNGGGSSVSSQTNED